MAEAQHRQRGPLRRSDFRGLAELAGVFLVAVVLSFLMVGPLAAAGGRLMFFSSPISPISPISSPISPISPLSPVSPISPLSPISPVRIDPGWTMFALPRAEVGPYTASGLIAELKSQGLDSRQIARWENGRWDSYIDGFPVNDFSIEAGRGYFMRTSRSGVWLARPRPSPTPTPTITPTPLPTATPTATPTPRPGVYQGVTQHAAATGLDVAMATNFSIPALMLGYPLSDLPAITGTSTIELVNGGSAETEVQVDFRSSDGTLAASRAITVAAGGRADLRLTELTDALPQPFLGAAVVSSTEPLGAVVREGLVGLAGDAMASLNVQPGGETRSVVPTVYRNYYGFSSMLLFHNPGAAPASVDVHLTGRGSFGTVSTVRAISLPPLNSAALNLGSDASIGDQFSGSAIVQADQPVQAVHVAQGGTDGGTFAAAAFSASDGATQRYLSNLFDSTSFGPLAALASARSGSGLLAVDLQGDGGNGRIGIASAGDLAGLVSAVFVMNVGSGSGSVLVSFFDASGATLASESRVLAPGQVSLWFVPNVASLPQGGRFSAAVSSDQPIVAYAVHQNWRGNPLLLGGEPAPSSGFTRTVAPVMLTSQADIALSLMNVGSVTATVQLTYRNADGTTRTSSSLSLEPNGSTLPWLDEAGFSTPLRGTVEVESDQPLVGEVLTFASTVLP